MLRVFAREVRVEHTGKVGQQDGQPAQQEHEQISPQRDAHGLCRSLWLREHQPGADEPQQRCGHHGHGKAAQQTAHAAKQPIIDKQLRAKTERTGQQQPPCKPADERAPVCAAQCLSRGEGGGSQQRAAKRAGAKDGAVRVFGDEIGGGESGQQRGEGRQRRGVFANELHERGSP